MDEDDLDQVLAIEEASYPTPWSFSAFLGEVRSEDTSYCLVAVEEGGKTSGTIVVAFLCSWIVHDLMQVNNIAVRQDRQGRGLGEEMMRAALAEGRRRRATACFLDVRPANFAARNLYRKLGFQEVGLRHDYYSDTGEDALVMRFDMT